MNQKLFQAIGLGLNLAPTFIIAIETLFGKQGGPTKKQAVMALVNASMFGAASGFGIAGDQGTSDAISKLQPTVSQVIDQTVSFFNQTGGVPTAASSAPVVVTAAK